MLLQNVHVHNCSVVSVHLQCAEPGVFTLQVYRGYVDDPRNTDNAWMETVAVNFHDATGDSVSKFKLHAGAHSLVRMLKI